MLETTSTFENLFEHPGDAVDLVLNRDQVDLVAISVGDCSQRRHPGQVERTDERGKTVSAMYAPACHNLLQ